MIRSGSKKLSSFIKNNKKLVIVIHRDPDGDAIGSAIALSSLLKQKGVVSSIICATAVPESYNFLPNFKLIHSLSTVYPQNKSATNHHLDHNNTSIISIDSGSQERTGLINRISVNIDHHMDNNGYADLNILDKKASATGEIIYDLAKALKLKITKDIAECLFVAISTDTGYFKYANTTARTFAIVNDLIVKGANPSRIAQLLYEQLSMAQLKQLADGLKMLKSTLGGRLVWAILKKRHTELDKGPMELIDYIRKVKSCEVAVVFKEKAAREVKLSLRSKGSFNVQQFANRYAGGGHKRASGCTIFKSLKETEQLVIKELSQALSK
ncbi:MAG: bifunctional oligoribonuclease/PAP phosphatase NrnA [Candidatus Margulisiibacteriota bacterium]|jgi:phosphoesterase RecJ-like protein